MQIAQPHDLLEPICDEDRDFLSTEILIDSHVMFRFLLQCGFEGRGLTSRPRVSVATQDPQR